MSGKSKKSPPSHPIQSPIPSILVIHANPLSRQPHDPLRTSPPHGRPQAQIRSRTRHHQTPPHRRSRRRRLDSRRPPEPSAVIQRIVKAGFRLPTFVRLRRCLDDARRRGEVPYPESIVLNLLPGPTTTATANCSAGTYRLGPPVPGYCRSRPIINRLPLVARSGWMVQTLIKVTFVLASADAWNAQRAILKQAGSHRLFGFKT